MDILMQILRAHDQQTKCALFLKHLHELLKSDIFADNTIIFLLKVLKIQRNDEHLRCIEKIRNNINLLSGLKRENDWIISLIVRAPFQSMKKLNS